MTQIINEPIRVTLEGATLIDHIATTNCKNIVKSGAFKTGVSDYYLVYCVRKLRGAIKHQYKYVTTLQMKNFSKEAFLSVEALVINAQDIDDAVNKWTQLFPLILEQHAPTLSKCVSDRYTPWPNADYFKLPKTRDKLKMQAASSMNKCFCNIGIKLSRKMLKIANPLLTGQCPFEILSLSFSFHTIMREKLWSTLRTMTTLHGSGRDSIASFCVKIAWPVAVGSLCDLFK